MAEFTGQDLMKGMVPSPRSRYQAPTVRGPGMIGGYDEVKQGIDSARRLFSDLADWGKEIGEKQKDRRENLEYNTGINWLNEWDREMNRQVKSTLVDTYKDPEKHGQLSTEKNQDDGKSPRHHFLFGGGQTKEGWLDQELDLTVGDKRAKVSGKQILNWYKNSPNVQAILQRRLSDKENAIVLKFETMANALEKKYLEDSINFHGSNSLTDLRNKVTLWHQESLKEDEDVLSEKGLKNADKIHKILNKDINSKLPDWEDESGLTAYINELITFYDREGGDSNLGKQNILKVYKSVQGQMFANDIAKLAHREGGADLLMRRIESGYYNLQIRNLGISQQGRSLEDHTSKTGRVELGFDTNQHRQIITQLKNKQRDGSTKTFERALLADKIQLQANEIASREAFETFFKKDGTWDVDKHLKSEGMPATGANKEASLKYGAQVLSIHKNHNNADKSSLTKVTNRNLDQIIFTAIVDERTNEQASVNFLGDYNHGENTKKHYNRYKTIKDEYAELLHTPEQYKGMSNERLRNNINNIHKKRNEGTQDNLKNRILDRALGLASQEQSKRSQLGSNDLFVRQGVDLNIEDPPPPEKLEEVLNLQRIRSGTPDADLVIPDRILDQAVQFGFGVDSENKKFKFNTGTIRKALDLGSKWVGDRDNFKSALEQKLVALGRPQLGMFVKHYFDNVPEETRITLLNYYDTPPADRHAPIKKEAKDTTFNVRKRSKTINADSNRHTGRTKENMVQLYTDLANAKISNAGDLSHTEAVDHAISEIDGTNRGNINARSPASGNVTLVNGAGFNAVYNDKLTQKNALAYIQDNAPYILITEEDIINIKDDPAFQSHGFMFRENPELINYLAMAIKYNRASALKLTMDSTDDGTKLVPSLIQVDPTQDNGGKILYQWTDKAIDISHDPNDPLDVHPWIQAYGSRHILKEMDEHATVEGIIQLYHELEMRPDIVNKTNKGTDPDALGGMVPVAIQKYGVRDLATVKHIIRKAQSYSKTETTDAHVKRAIRDLEKEWRPTVEALSQRVQNAFVTSHAKLSEDDRRRVEITYGVRSPLGDAPLSPPSMVPVE